MGSGFRMHAQALLPIDQTTLKVGTSDACKEVHASSENLLLMLKQVQICILSAHWLCLLV
jgi:hypothetical protein